MSLKLSEIKEKKGPRMQNLPGYHCHWGIHRHLKAPEMICEDEL
jgi:hypothetical protein